MKAHYLLFFLLVILYFVSRFYRLEELYTFSFDQYRDSWVVKKIIVDHQPTLLGPQSSFKGVFYGPLFYYALVPFYWLFHLKPIAGAFAAVFFGLTTLFLLYFAASKLFNPKVGLLASLLYIVSLYLNLLNRNCRNDPPLMSFSLILILILLNLAKHKNNQSRPTFFVLGLISGLGLHFHFAAISFLPLILISLLLLKVKVNLSKILLILAGFFIALAPLILFDLRHNFLVTKSLINLSSNSTGSYFWQNLVNNLILVLQTYWQIIIPQSAYLWLRIMVLLLSALGLVYCHKPKTTLVLLVWIIAPIIIFSFYVNQSSDYYYVLTYPIFLILMAASLADFSKKWRFLILFYFVFIVIANTISLTRETNPRSLSLTNQAMQFLKNDAMGKSMHIDYYSVNNFKVGFDYLNFAYGLNNVINPKQNGQNNYIIFVPAGKNKNLQYKAIFGDMGISIQQ